MKILYLAFARMPTEKAHGVQIIKMCEAFAKHGAEVTLCVPGRENSISIDPFSFYGVKELFKLCVANVPDFVRFGAFGFLFSLILFSERIVWKRVFWNSDIIFCRDAGVLLQYLLLGRRLVYEAHTAPTVISKIVARHAWKVITISQGLKDAYTKVGVSEHKILVAHDAVDVEIFIDGTFDRDVMRDKFSIPRGASVAMYIGRIDSWKGVETLLEASKLLTNVQVVVTGEGEQLDTFKTTYPNVIFTGPTPYTALPEVQNVADVLIIPNSARDINSRLYTSPLKVFAHMNARVPIVASDLPSLREILNEQNAYLVAPDNPQALADGIMNALKDTSELKTNQAAKDAQGYTWKNRAQCILEFLNSKA